MTISHKKDKDLSLNSQTFSAKSMNTKSATKMSVSTWGTLYNYRVSNSSLEQVGLNSTTLFTKSVNHFYIIFVEFFLLKRVCVVAAISHSYFNLCNHRYLKKSRLYQFCYVPATSAASSKGIFEADTNSTNQTNKAGGMWH